VNKVILILSDALRYDAAVAGMGYLGHLVEARLASLYKVIGELPSMSRPMYETLHTGLPVVEHGVDHRLTGGRARRCVQYCRAPFDKAQYLRVCCP